MSTLPVTAPLAVASTINRYVNPFAGEASTTGPTNPLTRSFSEWINGATGGPPPVDANNAPPPGDTATPVPPPPPPGGTIGPQSSLNPDSWDPGEPLPPVANQWDEEEQKRQLLAMLSEGNIDPYLQDYSQEMAGWG
jgi:hypothetical protein